MTEHGKPPRKSCATCDGTGRVIEHVCADCDGTGKARRIRARAVVFPPIEPTHNDKPN